MIYYLYGDDDFEIYNKLDALREQFGLKPDIIESDVEEGYLKQYLLSYSLLANKRMLIVKRLSENPALWKTFGDLIDNYDDQITIVCVDPKPDKRTATHKKLLKVAEHTEYNTWKDKLGREASIWVQSLASQKNVELTTEQVRQILRRGGGDKWAISSALDKLSYLPTFNQDTIDDLLETSLDENIYELIEVAIQGDYKKLSNIIDYVKSSEDPYRVFGLLASQLGNLCALCASGNMATDKVASDIGVHPYPLKKLKPLANELGLGGSRRLVELFAKSDRALKTSSINPWQIIEQMLYRASRVN